MLTALRRRASKRTLFNTSCSLPQLYHSLSTTRSALIRSRSFSSVHGVRPPSSRTEELPPEPIPNRPLRGERPIDRGRRNFDDDDNRAGGNKFERSSEGNVTNQRNPRSNRLGGNKPSRQSVGGLFLFDDDDEGKERTVEFAKNSPPRSSVSEKNSDFLEKFKLGFDKGEKPLSNTQLGKIGEEAVGEKAVTEPPMTPPQDADEIFKKMKETGLIPNAVAMLDGLCKDGLVQDAMKLFGLMREKGTIPEVVIYTAVVEGFCKVQKLDDAKRIFKKMQNNGIIPNAFSYTVLIQGLYKGKNVEDALEYCVEMLEAGHSPNLATFAGLIDGFCKQKGVVEAKSVIETLKQKGYFFDEKAGREYMEKKGPFSPLVWEAIFGTKGLHRKSF